MKKSFIYVIATVLAVIAVVLVGCSASTTPNQPTNPANVPSSSSTTTTTPASAAGTVPTQPAPSATTPSSSSTVSGQPASTGKLEIAVTDAPAKEEITSILVTLKSIEIHPAGSEATPPAQPGQSVQGTQETPGQPEDSGNWTTINVDPNDEFDLLKVKDNPEVLTSASEIIGNYSQVRMEVNTIKVQFAGTDKPVDATVPSGSIKFVQPFKVSTTDVTQLLFDFDAAQSVNVTGNGKVLFKPVIKLTVNHEPGNKSPNATQTNKGNPNQADLQITTNTLPSGTLNAPYAANIQLTANGGKTPYTWSISAGALPTGLSLNPTTGLISGTPTTSGIFNITVKVTDSSKPEAKTSTKDLTIQISASST